MHTLMILLFTLISYFPLFLTWLDSLILCLASLFFLCVLIFLPKNKKKGVRLWENGGEESNNKEKAAEHFVISAKLNPQNGAAFRYLGHYYSGVSLDTQRGLKCYQRAVSLNPDDLQSGVIFFFFRNLNSVIIIQCETSLLN